MEENTVKFIIEKLLNTCSPEEKNHYITQLIQDFDLPLSFEELDRFYEAMRNFDSYYPISYYQQKHVFLLSMSLVKYTDFHVAIIKTIINGLNKLNKSNKFDKFDKFDKLDKLDKYFVIIDSLDSLV